MSRTAVWKHISQLRRGGYHIDASPRRGYSLVSAPDSPRPEEIGNGLTTRLLGRRIAYYEEVVSTQDVAKALAASGAGEGTVVIAERQVAGRGRLGRRWVSPPGGVYLSIILRPEMKPLEALRFPLMAGVGVAQAIEKVAGLKPRLKWPNDIIVNGRKAGGILVEMSAEVDRVDYVIIGIGVNANSRKELLPTEVQGLATTLLEECGKQVSRVELIQSILAELEMLYDDSARSGFEPVRQRWKQLSNTIGSWVVIGDDEGAVKGTAEDIDSDGALIVRQPNGNLERIVAGDVSLGNSHLLISAEEVTRVNP